MSKTYAMALTALLVVLPLAAQNPKLLLPNSFGSGGPAGTWSANMRLNTTHTQQE